jgi:hypothetical protein
MDFIESRVAWFTQRWRRCPCRAYNPDNSDAWQYEICERDENEESGTRVTLSVRHDRKSDRSAATASVRISCSA